MSECNDSKYAELVTGAHHRVCAVLCCAVLCCAVLCCAVLCCVSVTVTALRDSHSYCDVAKHMYSVLYLCDRM